LVVVVVEVVVEVAAETGDGGGDIVEQGGLVALLEQGPLGSLDAPMSVKR
jgi:hypothetical protein